MEIQTAGFTDLVQASLDAVEARMRTSPEPHDVNLDAALDHLLSSGGKRIRPTLVLLAGGMLGAEEERAITLAAAIELLHTATLVHDDLIDGAMLRRGIPTLNAEWNDGATVLTGDYIFARAAYLAAQTGSLPVMESFARTLMTIVNGELVQLFRAGTHDLRQDYLNRIHAKTGSLFELAGEGAALLVQADEATLRTMKRFGRQVGKAFQIVDDVLDFIGDPRAVGKPVASDLRQGLITLPTLYYLENHPEERTRIESFAQNDGDGTELDALVVRIRASGAVDLALQEAGQYADAAQDLLSRFPPSPERAALKALAGYAVQRTV